MRNEKLPPTLTSGNTILYILGDESMSQTILTHKTSTGTPPSNPGKNQTPAYTLEQQSNLTIFTECEI